MKKKIRKLIHWIVREYYYLDIDLSHELQSNTLKRATNLSLVHIMVAHKNEKRRDNEAHSHTHTQT